MLSIGERLKAAREAKGISLERASQVTKIQRTTLGAIEKGDLGEILDPVYAKIFLKKYALYLGLDGSSIVSEYLSLRGPIPDRPIGVKTQALPEAQSRLSIGKWIFPVSVGLMGVVGISFLAYLAMDLKKSLASIPKKEKAVSSKKAARPNPTLEKASSPQLLVPRSQPLKLTIRTKSEVWMQVKADGTIIFQNVLAKGSQETWEAKEDLELWTGNAGAMELVLNGKALGSPGTGVKKGIKITREGIKG